GHAGVQGAPGGPREEAEGDPDRGRPEAAGGRQRDHPVRSAVAGGGSQSGGEFRLTRVTVAFLLWTGCRVGVSRSPLPVPLVWDTDEAECPGEAEGDPPPAVLDLDCLPRSRLVNTIAERGLLILGESHPRGVLSE